VLEQTKEPGAPGEPLYLDVVTTLAHACGTRERMPHVIGGRYGISSKDFTPAMVKAVFEEMKLPDPKTSFTLGIDDDVSHTSLDVDPTFSIEHSATVQALFYGLGADGTVGANKNSVKIIAEDAGLYAQGYFVYDSHKSGAQTISHLRFGPEPIHSPYLIASARFVACHQFGFLARQDVLRFAAPGAVFLLNSPFAADRVWDRLPRPVQQQSSTSGCVFLSLTLPRSPAMSASAPVSIPCCRLAFLPFPGCCHATLLSAISRRRSAKPMLARAKPWSARILRPLIAP
jgi:pyruvate-ferredoxin/flavodoxin oxidoreductase